MSINKELILSIKTTPNKGRGVFTSVDIRKDTVIESCELIIVPTEQRKQLDGTILYNYYFSWGLDKSEAAFALGYGSLYNHSYNPNASYIKDEIKLLINIVAIRNISAGEEITVNYSGNHLEKKPLWFTPVLE